MKRLIPCLIIILMLSACAKSRIAGKWIYTYPDGDTDTLEFSSGSSFSCVFWDGEESSGKYSLEEYDDGSTVLNLKTDGNTRTLGIVIDKDGLAIAGKLYIKDPD